MTCQEDSVPATGQHKKARPDWTRFGVLETEVYAVTAAALDAARSALRSLRLRKNS